MANSVFLDVVDQLKENNRLIIENNAALELSAFEMPNVNQKLDNVATGFEQIALKFSSIAKTFVDTTAGIELIAFEFPNFSKKLSDVVAGIELIAFEFPNFSKKLSDVAAGIELIAFDFSSSPKQSNSTNPENSSNPANEEIKTKTKDFSNYENLIKAFTSINIKDLLIAKFALTSYIDTLIGAINKLSEVKLPNDNEGAFKIFETFSSSLKNFSSLDKKSVKLIPKALDNLTNGIISSFKKLKEAESVGESVVDTLKIITDSFELFKDLDFKKILTIRLALPLFAKSVTSAFKVLSLIKNPQIIEKTSESLGRAIKNLFEPLKGSVEILKTASTSLIKFGVASLLFAGSLLAFNYVKPESVALFVASLASLAAASFAINKAGGSKGALTLAAFGVSLIPLAFGLKMLSDVKWETLAMAGSALTGLVAASFAIQKSGGVKGALAIAALGASLLPLAFSLKMLSDVKWETLAIAGTAIVGLAAAAFGLSFIAPAIFVGSLAIAALGASLLPLALSLNMLSSINSEMLTSLGSSLLILVASILPILPFSPLFGLFALSLIPLSVGLFALSKVGNKLSKASDFFDRFSVFNKTLEPSKIFSFSTSLGALSAALVAFGAANVVTGISNLVTKFLSFGADSPIEQIIKLSNSADDLFLTANSIFRLAEAMGEIAKLGPDAFAGFNSFPWEKIEDIADELSENSIIQIVPNMANMPSTTLNEVGSSLSNGGQTINVINAPNNGGNVSTTNMSNQTTNVKTGPRIVTGSAMDL